MKIRRLRLPGRPGAVDSPAAKPARQPSTIWTRPEPPECPPDWTVGPPDFVIFGASKAGTTRWHRLLGLHPAVQMAPQEIHFWDDFVDRWPDASDIERYHSHFPRPAGSLAGDKTPRYLSLFWAASMLAEAAPLARIIVILRDPIERYGSVRTFDERLRAPRVRAGLSDNSFTRSIVDRSFLRGLYAQQLPWLYQSFPPERVLVLQFEACVADAPGQLRRTQRFLGIQEEMPPPEAFDAEINASKGPKVVTEPERVALMRDLFEPDVLALRQMVPDLDLALWPNFAHLATAKESVAAGPSGSV